jgi:hypothetical protein
MNLLKLAVAAMTVAASAGSSPYEPAGPWVLTGQDAQCKLSREFQQNGRAARLVFETLPLSGSVSVIVDTVGANASAPLGFSTPMLVSGDNKNLRKIQMQGFLSADNVHHYGRFGLPKDEFEKLANGSGFGLVQRGWVVGFRLPKFSDAARALRDCEPKVFKDVAARIGISGTDASRIAQPAQVPMILRRTAGPLPTKLPPGQDIEDEAVAVYIVSPAGKMIGCAVVQRAKAEELNARACESWTPDFPFTPAKDANGQAINGFAFQVSNW